MAHNTLVRNPTSLWTEGSTVTPGEWAKIDLNLAQAINATTGGTWLPQNQIVITGQGLNISGPVVIRNGGTLQAGGVGGVFLFDDNDFPVYGPNHSGRTRTIMYPCALGEGHPILGWRCRFSDGGMQAVAQTIDLSDGFGPQQSKLWIPLRCHDGSTLTQVVVNFRIGFPHPQLPPNPPAARVIRQQTGVSGLLPLTSIAAGATGPDGFIQCVKPSNVAQWTGQQSITVPCDQNNVIDLSQYEYYVEIDEETGLSGYPWALIAKAPVLAADTLSSFTSPFVSTVDGVSIATGGRVLLGHGGNAAEVPLPGSIYVTTATSGVKYASDMMNPSDFTQGMIVPVQRGGLNAGSYFQASSSVGAWSPDQNSQIGGGKSTWASSTAFVYGSLVVPTVSNGFYYVNTDGTPTGSTEPIWPTTVGATVTDNASIWRCAGALQQTPLLFVQASDADDETPATAGTAFFAHGNIYQSVTATFTSIDDGHFQ